MNRFLKAAVAGSFVVALASTAIAQTASSSVRNEENNVEASRPDGWVDVKGNDRAVFNFKHEDSHSQIEVISQQLLTADVADVFFNQFHETLKNSEFSQTAREQKAYGSHSGTETTYSFAHSGATLKVSVFQFVQDTTAWLVVLYVQDDLHEQYAPAYRSTVTSLRFGE